MPGLGSGQSSVPHQTAIPSRGLPARPARPTPSSPAAPTATSAPLGPPVGRPAPAGSSQGAVSPRRRSRSLALVRHLGTVDRARCRATPAGGRRRHFVPPLSPPAAPGVARSSSDPSRPETRSLHVAGDVSSASTSSAFGTSVFVAHSTVTVTSSFMLVSPYRPRVGHASVPSATPIRPRRPPPQRRPPTAPGRGHESPSRVATGRAKRAR